MKISDDMLAAYVDDELDADGRIAVEAAMADDPAVAEAVARQRRLREALRASFDPVLDEPLPDRLRILLQAPAADTPGPVAEVVDLGAARAARSERRRWALPEWAAMAASLVIGVLVAQWWPGERGDLIGGASGALVAEGALAQALDRQLASDTQTASAIGVGLSFRDADGRLCRTFAVDQAQPLAGMACRTDGRWQLPVLLEVEADSGGAVRMASSALPAALLDAVDARIAGEPLDAEAERAARDAGWR